MITNSITNLIDKKYISDLGINETVCEALRKAFTCSLSASQAVKYITMCERIEKIKKFCTDYLCSLIIQNNGYPLVGADGTINYSFPTQDDEDNYNAARVSFVGQNINIDADPIVLPSSGLSDDEETFLNNLTIETGGSGGTGERPKVLTLRPDNNQSLGTGSSYQVVDMDTVVQEDTNESDNFNFDNNYYTVPADTSLLWVQARICVNVGYTGNAEIKIVKNSVAYSYANHYVYYGGRASVELNELVKVSQNDALYIAARHTCGYSSDIDYLFTRISYSRWE